MSKVLRWSISTIREKIRSIIADSRNIAHLFLGIEIKKLNMKNDTIIIEGTYRYLLEEGKFHIELDESTLGVKRIEIE